MMKQFSKILKFELLNYFKNKTFMGITLFLVIAIIVVVFIPNIIPDGEGGESALTPMYIYSEEKEISALATEYFKEVFPDYKVTAFEGTLDELKNKITSGEAECAFALNGISSYTYYVNNLSIYDTNTQTANLALQEVYRVTAMIQNGMTPSQAGEIMATQIESTTETLGKDQTQNFFYTYILIMALYMVILLYGQMVATNVASEKSSRAMELLVTSANPTAMMFGKVLAPCIAGLTQLIAIFGTALVCFNINKEAWEGNMIIESIFNIPFNLFGYLLVFFVLGFLIYAFLYGAIGSTASKLEDINTSVMPITFLFVIAFMVAMISMSGSNTDNMLIKICSFIPFTSSMTMFTRICLSTVPWYEILISIIILVASTIGVGIVSAKIYRIGVLLYGTPPKLGAIIKAIKNS